MAQTTEQPTLISPASEADTSPYTRPAKKTHVPPGMGKLIFVGFGLLLVLLAVVLIFSHKMSPTKSRGQASKRTPNRQQARATNGVVPADHNNTPSAAIGDDPDSITPNGILATKNSLEAQKRRAKEAADAVKPSETRKGAANGTQQSKGSSGSTVQTSKHLNAPPKTIGSIAPFQPPVYNGAVPHGQLVGGPGAVATHYQSGPLIVSQCAHGTMR